MRNGRRFLERFWQTDWSLSALLVLILVDTFILAPLLQSRDAPGLLVLQLSIFSVFLLSGVAFAFRNPALTAIVGAFAAGAFLVRWTSHFHPSLSLARIESALSLVFCVLLGAVILILVLRSGPINAQRFQGAVAL